MAGSASAQSGTLNIVPKLQPLCPYPMLSELWKFLMGPLEVTLNVFYFLNYHFQKMCSIYQIGNNKN